MTPLTRATLLVRNPDLISTDMDGDMVMMSIERGEYYGLGGVGGYIWNRLEQPATLGALVDAVCSEYDVEEAACEGDLLRFVGTLLEHGALTRC